jgi:hypothetical protein
MKRTVGLLIATLAVASAAPAAAAPPKTTTISGALGNLRWGMSEHDVKTALRTRIKDKAALQALDSSYAEFDSKASRWDRTPVAEEYTHGNDEAMLSYKDSDGSENYYFFIGGQLWKWVKYMPASAFGGSDFDKFSTKIEGRFGKGYSKEAEVNQGTGKRYKLVEFLDRNTRLRAVDKTKGQGQFALMFESMDTVRSLSSLRANAPVRSKKPAAEVAQDDSSERSAPSKAQPSRAQGTQSQNAFTLAAAAKNGKSKSLFNEDGNKTDENSYQAKRERVQNEARDRQRKTYERKEEAKKGKELDSLAGVEDDDPIGGMK